MAIEIEERETRRSCSIEGVSVGEREREKRWEGREERIGRAAESVSPRFDDEERSFYQSLGKQAERAREGRTISLRIHRFVEFLRDWSVV